MTDLVERLRKMEALKPGAEIPREFYDDAGNWGSKMAALFGAAATEIERLRAEIAAIRQLAGCVEIPLKSFDDLKKEIKHVSSS